MFKQNATPKRKSPHNPMTIGNTNVIPIGDCSLLLKSVLTMLIVEIVVDE